MSVLLHDLDRIESGVYFLSVDVNDDDVPMYILGKNNGVRSTFYALGQIESVPPHGDLIDRDALPTGRVEWEDIVQASVVIPAEEGEV